MCVGKTNRREPESNRELAEFAQQRAQTHKDVILPMEMQEIAQLRDETYQEARGTLLSGRANADAAVAEHNSLEGLRRDMGGLGPGNFGAVSAGEYDVIGGSQDRRTAGVVGGHAASEGMTMSDRLEALNTGAGHERGVASGLSSLTRGELMQQQAEADGEQAVGRALSGLAVTAGASGYLAHKRALDSTVPYDSLRPLGKGLRNLYGPTEQQASLYNAGQGGGGTQVGPSTVQPLSNNAFQLPNMNGGTQVGPMSVTPTSNPTSTVNGPSNWSTFTNWI